VRTGRRKTMDKLVEANQRALDLQYMLDSAKQEVERLRAALAHELDLRDRHIESLEARIKELQDLIDKPPEEADWVADYHLLQSALDGPIIDAARKWHAAYRKAQNSNLMRAKEVERLRSLNESLMENGNDLRTRCQKAEARIKELEAEKERIESAFLKAESQRLWDLGKSTGETSYDCQEAHEALERIRSGKDVP